MIAAESYATAGLKPADEVLIEPVGEGELGLRTRQQVHLSCAEHGCTARSRDP